MRFFWLSVSVVIPVGFIHLIEYEANENIALTYGIVASAFLVFAIAITVSEFVKHRNKERHAENRLLLQERDEDIKNWRKAFFSETADLYDAQKMMLTKAQELGEHHVNYRDGPRVADTADDSDSTGGNATDDRTTKHSWNNSGTSTP